MELKNMYWWIWKLDKKTKVPCLFKEGNNIHDLSEAVEQLLYGGEHNFCMRIEE